MAVEDWMPTLETKIGAIAGLDGGARSPYSSSADNPGLPHSLQEFPIAIITVVSGKFEYGASLGLDYTRVQITLFVGTAAVLSEAQNIAVPFIAKMRDKIAANTSLDGTVEHILPSTEEETFEGPGAVSYNGKDHTGIIFRYNVKENTAADFSVTA